MRQRSHTPPEAEHALLRNRIVTQLYRKLCLLEMFPCVSCYIDDGMFIST